MFLEKYFGRLPERLWQGTPVNAVFLDFIDKDGQKSQSGFLFIASTPQGQPLIVQLIP